MFRIPPDPADHWPTSDTPQHVTPDAGWADTIAGLLNGIPGWTWAAAFITLLVASLFALPLARRHAHKAGQRAAGHASSTDRRDRALLIAALTPASLMWLATLSGSARGLLSFGRDTLRWTGGWEWLVPGTLDGVGISFAFLAFRAVRKGHNPDRSIRVAWGAMGASAAINFSHEAGLANGSALGGVYLGLLSIFAMLIFHELLDQFEDGTEWIKRDNPKFGLRWLTWPTNTACAWVAWRNYPPAEGTKPTIAVAVAHLDQVRADKRRRRAQQLSTEIAAPRWTVVWPWARITQLSAAVAEHRTAIGAEQAHRGALMHRLEATEQARTEAARQAEQYAERLAVAAAERETEQAGSARTVQETERLRTALAEQAEQIRTMRTEHAAQLAALRTEQPYRSTTSSHRTPSATSGKPARTGGPGAARLTDEEAIALMLREHPERGYEWGSREVHRLTGAGFGRVAKLIAAVAEHHERSGAPEQSERSDDADAEHAGAAVSA